MSDALPPDVVTAPIEGAADPAEGDAPVRPAEARAAAALWQAAAAVLDTGIPGAGSVTRAALLRAAHDARAVGLHRGATAAIRVVDHLRAAATEDPAFRLDELVHDLWELLSVAHRLRQPDARVDRGLRGIARRQYRVAAGARLYGLCVEPVATASGYGGAVTLLADESGTVWQVSTVVPGGADVARFAARRPVSLGEVRLNHSALARAGVLASQLRASADGRISGGRGTVAVAAEGVSWWEPPLAALWRPAWADQLERYRSSLELTPAQRPAVAGLVFLDATVLGAAAGGVGLLTADRSLVAVAAHDSPELAYVDNLRLLARAAGAELRLVARPVGAGRIAPVAMAAPWLPDAYGGHVDLGLDRLRRAHLPAEREVTVPEFRGDAPAPLRPLRRRLERAVEGGRAAVPGDQRELEQLRALLPNAGDLAERLETTARPRHDAFGRAMREGHEEFARAWLAAATYVQATLR